MPGAIIYVSNESGGSYIIVNTWTLAGVRVYNVSSVNGGPTISWTTSTPMSISGPIGPTGQIGLSANSAGTLLVSYSNQTFTVGSAITNQNPTVTSTFSSPTYQYSILEGTALPSGLVLNSSNGIISGTPTTSGTFVIKIVVYDGAFRVLAQPTYTIN